MSAVKRLALRLLGRPGVKRAAQALFGALQALGARGLAATRQAGDRPAGEAGVRALGHRAYVGGDGAGWETIGRLQFRFLVERGLTPDHVLLDIACGALRAGVLLIPYLRPGHYLGVEREALLVERGIEEELGRALNELKQPEFLISERFEFERLSKRPDIAIAQSLFTHLAADDIALCMTNLRRCVAAGARLYATFFESARPHANPPASHPHKPFRYSRAEIERFGTEHGWEVRYIGDWSHPRGQVMVEYTAREG